MAIPDLADLTSLPNKDLDLLRHIFNTTQMGITIYSPDNGWVDANDTFCNMLGYTRDELFMLGFKEIIHPENIKVDKQLFGRILGGDINHYSLDNRYLKKDGTSLHAYVTIEGVRDQKGNVNYCIAFIRDLTEQRMTEQALVESEKKYQSLIETTTDWIWEIDRDGRYVYSNPTVKTLLGFQAEEVMCKDIYTFMDEQQREFLGLSIQQSLQGNSGWHGLELTRRHKDGNIRIFESNANPVYSATGEITGFRGSDRDITERINAQNTLYIRSTQQSVIAQIGHFALQSSDLSSLMDLIVTKLAGTLSVEYTKILEFLPASGNFLLCAGVGWSEGLVGTARVSGDRHSQAGYTLGVEHPVIVEDLDTETRFSGPSLLKEHNIVSGMSVVTRKLRAT